MILSLKRSTSDVDHLVPVGTLTPPASAESSPDRKTPKTRTGRAFSWTKLTESIKGKTRSRPFSRTSSASDPKRLPSTSSPSPQDTSALPSRGFKSAFAAAGHLHSVSDPSNNSSPEPPRQGLRLLPLRAADPSFSSVAGSLDSPLENIPESPLERAIAILRVDSCQEKLRTMESARLQPPTMGGTKARAIQQAKEMEVLVAERAKRSGDEPPPYDFYELIGKGAYGRVFKG